MQVCVWIHQRLSSSICVSAIWFWLWWTGRKKRAEVFWYSVIETNHNLWLHYIFRTYLLNCNNVTCVVHPHGYKGCQQNVNIVSHEELALICSLSSPHWYIDTMLSSPQSLYLLHGWCLGLLGVPNKLECKHSGPCILWSGCDPLWPLRLLTCRTRPFALEISSCMPFLLNSCRFSKYSSTSRSSCLNNVSSTIFRPQMSMAALKYFSSFRHGASKSLSAASSGPDLQFRNSKSQMLPSSNCDRSGKQVPRTSATHSNCWWTSFRSHTEKSPAQLIWGSPGTSSALRLCRWRVLLWQVTANLHSMTFHCTMKPSLKASSSSKMLLFTATQPSRLSTRSISTLFISKRNVSLWPPRSCWLCLQRPPFAWRKPPSGTSDIFRTFEKPVIIGLPNW